MYQANEKSVGGTEKLINLGLHKGEKMPQKERAESLLPYQTKKSNHVSLFVSEHIF